MRVESFAQADIAEDRTLRPNRSRAPRVASERSDIDYLLGALNSLTEQVVELIGPPGSYRGNSRLRRAVWASRQASYRVVKNKAARDARPKRQKAAA